MCDDTVPQHPPPAHTLPPRSPHKCLRAPDKHTQHTHSLSGDPPVELRDAEYRAVVSEGAGTGDCVLGGYVCGCLGLAGEY